MPKSLSKVTKHLHKKKGDIKSLHTNSRDAQSLRRASARDDKLVKHASTRAKINEPYLKRLAFFQGAAKAGGPESDEPGRTDFDMAQTQSLITAFLARDVDELAKLEKERRAGRPPSSREDLLKQRIARDKSEYEAGFWVPDMGDDEKLMKLQQWDGNWGSLGSLHFLRVSKLGMIMPSTFPPKGQS